MRLSARERRRLAIVDNELSADPVLTQLTDLFAVPRSAPNPDPRRTPTWRGRFLAFFRLFRRRPVRRRLPRRVAG
jgi:hypothetical protein